MTDAAGSIAGVGTRDAARTARQRERLLDWVATIDHKRVGVLYLVTTLGFFCLGGLEALLMRIQLARPESALLTPDVYNQLFTMHGTTMVFLVVMPLLTGFANYLVPLMIGARDVAFPRLNAFSYWLLLFGGLLLYFSFMAGGAPNAGWFSYAPLSERPYSSSSGLDYWALALLVLGIGSIASAINIIVTILTLRADGLTIRRLPLFVWMTLVNSFLILAALPALNASLVMLLVDRLLGGHFFIAPSTAAVAAGRGAILWQHFFWSFGHPEVYIMVLPAFGIISEVIPVFSRKPIFGYEFVAGSTVAIALLSYGVWAHHMFAVGLGHPFDAAFSGASLLIAVPTGVKIFNWIATMWGGSIRLTTSMLFAIGFLVMFPLGGVTGVMVAVVPIDWQVTDSYFIVAHMHYVLFGGTAFAVLAGVYYWFPKITGRLLDERWGVAHFWLTVIGFNLTFFDQHLLGMMGMPRRVFTYPALPYWGALNLASTIGACVLGVSVIVLVWNVWMSLRHGQPAGNNPWDAWTLEWATTSPPPEHNFDTIPPVGSRRPLWDLAHPDRRDPDGGASLGETPAFVAHPPVERAALGMLLFLASEAVFFIFLVIGYVYLHSADVQRASQALDPRVTGVYTVALLASSATIWLAGRGARVHRGWLLATIALGLVFLVGQSREYWRLLHENVTVSRDLFGTLFYTLTGIHGVHVASGVVMMLVLLGVLWRSTKVALDRVGLESVALYWHLVDAVWIVIFSVVYLGGRYIA